MRFSHELGTPRCLAEDAWSSADPGAEGVPQLLTETVAFDPADPAFIDDPFPFYRALREIAPVHFEDSIGGWVFTRYDDVRRLLGHPDVVRPPVTDYLFGSLSAAERLAMSGFERVVGASLPFSNPPHHTRLRKLVSKAFTPRTAEAMRPRIQQLTDSLLDQIGIDGGGDLLAHVAYPLPSTVTLEFIGVPEPDHARMIALTTQLMGLLGAQFAADPPAVLRASHEAMNEFTEYLGALIAERRATPREDLLSTLITASSGEDGGITDEELIVNCVALLNAALETTANYLGNGMLALLRHPAQLRLLRENPALAASAAEELLRFDGPVPIMTPQYAAADVEIGGQLITQGQLLYPAIAAANRDPSRFPDPDRLDVTRPLNGHLSFGGGIHFCLGAALALIEGEVLFGTLARRFPDVRLDPYAEAPTFRADPVLRGLTALPVRT